MDTKDLQIAKYHMEELVKILEKDPNGNATYAPLYQSLTSNLNCINMKRIEAINPNEQ